MPVSRFLLPPVAPEISRLRVLAWAVVLVSVPWVCSSRLAQVLIQDTWGHNSEPEKKAVVLVDSSFVAFVEWSWA